MWSKQEGLRTPRIEGPGGMILANIPQKVNSFGRLFIPGRGDRVVIVLVSKTSGLCASRVRIPSAAPQPKTVTL